MNINKQATSHAMQFLKRLAALEELLPTENMSSPPTCLDVDVDDQQQSNETQSRPEEMKSEILRLKKQWFHRLHDITSVYTSLLFWYTWYVCIEKYHNVSFTGLLQINSLNPQSLASAETVASSSPIPASNTENSGAYRSTGGRENDLHHLSV